MTPANEHLVERVRKLLAKAESTSNPHEAELFSAKAAELIAAHRLDPQQLRDALTHGSLGLRRLPLGRGAYVRARLALLMAVAGSQDCEVVFQTGADGTTAIVAGFESDLDLTELLFTSLHTQAAAQMAAIRRQTPAATQRYRRSFLFGYARRVGELLDDAARTSTDAEAVGRGDSRQGSLFDETLPDTLERSQRVKAFVASSFGRVATASAPRPAQASGWKDGHRAAGGADLGRQRLHGRRALGPGR
jgi:hypothetical protein